VTDKPALPPPADIDAEAAVLSAAMLKPTLLDDLSRELSDDYWYDPRHRILWGAIRSVAAGGSQLDAVTVAGHLRAQGRLEQAGGAAYLAELIDATPSTSRQHVLEYVELVVDRWRARTAIEVFIRAQALSRTAARGDIDAILAGAAAEIDALSRRADREQTIWLASELAVEQVERMRRIQAGVLDPMGLCIGLHELDEMIGGFKGGWKYEVAGRPGSGKTGFLTTAAVNVAQQGLGVVFISVEMTREQSAHRMIGQLSGLDSKAITRGRMKDGDWEKFVGGVQALKKLPIALDECWVQSPRSIRATIREAMRRLESEHPGIKLGLIVIDYVQLLEDDEKATSNEQRIAHISRATKMLAKEFNVPVLEAAQLSRKCEERPDKRPIMSDLRDSGTLEQDADVILMLYRDDYYKADGVPKDFRAEVLVRKVRNDGETGVAVCGFHGSSTKFVNLAGSAPRDRDEPPPDYYEQPSMFDNM
jgi:replicative DNA helicase